MPLTPNFDIFYPCADDPIDCEEFTTFTESIQVALDDMDVLVEQALSKPTAKIQTFASAQTVTVNTQTTVQFQTEVIDNDNMVDLAVSNSRITIQTAGVYLVHGKWHMAVPFTTVSSQAVALLQNGTRTFRKRDSTDNNSAMTLQIIAAMSCAVGDFIQMSVLWTGTGGPSTITGTTLNATLLTLP